MKLDLEAERLREAERRLRILGDLLDAEYDHARALDRARAALVPFKVLKQWLTDYQAGGLPELVPDWDELTEKAKAIIRERRGQLGGDADAETITAAEITEIAERNGWSYRRAKKWLQRYRTGGLWALAPENNPERRRRPPGRKRDLATLDEAALETVYERRGILGDLADQRTVTNDQVRARAGELRAGGVIISERTLWNYLRDYRKEGLAGLAPRQRSDKGKRHAISDWMTQVIAGIRLSNPDWRVRAVYEEACRKARALDETEPSEWQVRDICNQIPRYVKLIADGRRDAFRDNNRITYPIRFKGIVYQVDHTQVDVLVKDLRAARHRSKSGEIRPWLTTILDSRSRLVMAAIFAYDRPDRFTVAAAIRQSLLVTEDKPYGGIPDEIWVDHGKELLSHHVAEITQELGIHLYPCTPNQPQVKGIVERFYGTLNTRLWSTLPGYVSSNTVERNPNAKAKLELVKLVSRFWEFIERYHGEEHSATGMSPLAYWLEHCAAEPVDPRKLDLLLMERAGRTVQKIGIEYRNRVYWHSALGELVGERVLLRAGPSYPAPDEIEVFHDDKWICTAFATDSVTGLSVTRQQVRAAQREQRQSARQLIDEARGALKEAEREIEERQSGNGSEPSEQKAEPVTQSSARPRKAGRRSDFLDYLVERGDTGDSGKE